MNNFTLCFMHNYLMCILPDDDPTGIETFVFEFVMF
jgi:hypothetical protein